MYDYLLPITTWPDSDFQGEVLPIGANLWHPRRQLEYMTARVALCSLLRDLGYDVGGSDLGIEHYCELKCFPDLLVSLSHNPDFAIAFVAEKKSSSFLRIGVDIEMRDRVIKPHLSSFFIHPLDDQEQYSLLELWVLKEAAYKAISSEGLTLKQIWISGSFFGIGNRLSKKCGRIELSLYRYKGKQVVVGKAYFFSFFVEKKTEN